MNNIDIRYLPYSCLIERNKVEEGYDYCVRKLVEEGAIIALVEKWVGEAIWEAAWALDGAMTKRSPHAASCHPTRHANSSPLLPSASQAEGGLHDEP